MNKNTGSLFTRAVFDALEKKCVFPKKNNLCLAYFFIGAFFTQ